MTKKSLDDFLHYQMLLDLWPLEAYIAILEAEVPRIIQAERQKIWQNVKSDDEQQHYYASLAEQELDEGITTRQLTGAALIAIWGIYESVVSRVAKRVKESKSLSDEMKGSSLMKMRKYFEDVLKINLHPQSTDWHNLGSINLLRDALAHANGQLEYVKDKRRNQIELWVATVEGVKISGGYLIVSASFVRQTFDLVSDLLTELDNRINGC